MATTVESGLGSDPVSAPKGVQSRGTSARFGTFGGVFTPTILTSLGVILFLREGWVIGNAGIGGGVVIILLGFGITGLTALSMSSITTNLRLGAGGAYAIIAHSLGLEVGCSLGIPRYLSQALAVTMYLFGFGEGWRGVALDLPRPSGPGGGPGGLRRPLRHRLHQRGPGHPGPVRDHGRHRSGPPLGGRRQHVRRPEGSPAQHPRRDHGGGGREPGHPSGSWSPTP